MGISMEDIERARDLWGSVPSTYPVYTCRNLQLARDTSAEATQNLETLQVDTLNSGTSYRSEYIEEFSETVSPISIDNKNNKSLENIIAYFYKNK